MNWLRNWSRGRKEGRKCSTQGFQPRLEMLEDRTTPNVSQVFDSAGALTTFVVTDDGAMTMFSPSGQMTTLGTSGVRVAHGYRDAQGAVAVDVVFTDGTAAEFTTRGRFDFGTGILDASHAVDKAGNERVDILFASTPGSFGNLATGDLYEFVNGKAGTKIASGIYFATAYVDVKGVTGLAFGEIDAAFNAFVTVSDSTGTRSLYNGSAVITQCIGDYDQASFGGTLLVNIVQNPANSGAGSQGSPHTALEFAPNGVLGLGFNIKPL